MEKKCTRNKIGLAVLLVIFVFGAARSPAMVKLPSIGDYVWEDLDADGIQDAGEPGIEGVMVNLYDCDDNLIDTTTTDSFGFYLFDNLEPGDYYVEFVLPSGYAFTMQDQGTDDDLDSDADPVTGMTMCTTLDSGEEDLTWDAGMVRAPSCQLEVTKQGCVLIPGKNDCQGKVTSMTLKYTGQGCDASSHSQDPRKVKCSGDLAGAGPVDIFVTNNKGDRTWGSALGIPIGGSVLADAANAGKDNLDADTLVIITNASGDVLQELKFHTSCSQPLGVGDQFGSMKLVSLTTTEGGTVSLDGTCVTELPGLPGPFDVEYTYTITNTGPTTVTGVTVIDDQFGEHPDSPILSIQPGKNVTLTLIVPLSDPTTNTVVVTAAEGCRAEATATITKAPPEPAKCTTKVQAMLLEYIGPPVPGTVTVTFIGGNKKLKNDPTTYTLAGGLVPGTQLSSPAENNWTIDATAHKQSELGSKVSILINGVKEVIHTSCSTPFVSGKPAPLDRPKGDPSLNWFVVSFVQK